MSRLRGGEVVVGLSAVALLVLMFAVHWYGSRTGWQQLTHLRWLILVTALSGLALVWFQATCRSPAIPVSLSVIVTVLALITAVWIGWRVIVSQPPHQHVGAVLGLLAACGMVAGGWLSMREEGIAPTDGPGEIPTIRLREVSPGT